jgi:benzoylformate decarboxylase
MNITPKYQKYDMTYPDPNGIKRAAETLIHSTNTVLIVGDRVSDENAIDEAIQLAELLAIPVYQSRGAEVSFPTTHPQYVGIHSLRVKKDRQILSGFDTVLAVGMDPFNELFYWGDVILNSESTLIHIDSIYSRIGKSEPTHIGIVSNCKNGLSELISELRKLDSQDYTNRREKLVSQIRNNKDSYEYDVMNSPTWNKLPMPPARMMYEISKALPENSLVVDDSISNSGALRHFINANKRNDIRGVRGQSIGGGIGATMGTQCAFPNKTVFGIIGDGSAMMTIQGLWTAANDNIPCKFVICNNGMYRVLKVNFNIYQKDILEETETIGENLSYTNFDTPFNIPEIAQGMGIKSERIINPENIGAAIKRAFDFNGPYLIDIKIDGTL